MFLKYNNKQTNSFFQIGALKFDLIILKKVHAKMTKYQVGKNRYRNQKFKALQKAYFLRKCFLFVYVLIRYVFFYLYKSDIKEQVTIS